MRSGTQDDQWKAGQIYIKPPLYSDNQTTTDDSSLPGDDPGPTIDFQVHCHHG